MCSSNGSRRGVPARISALPKRRTSPPRRTSSSLRRKQSLRSILRDSPPPNRSPGRRVAGDAAGAALARPARPSAFEPLKAELAKLELARSQFARTEGRKIRDCPAGSREAGCPATRVSEAGAAEVRIAEARPGAIRTAATGAPGADKAGARESEPARPPAAASPPALRAAEEGLLSPRTTAAVDLAFNTLAQTVLVQNSRTLEDLVREMLKPMLKAWLDDNLPGLVERLVRAEIERVSRGRS